MKNGKNNYPKKKKIIINVFQTISGLIIINAIFLPWIQVRIVSLQSLYFLCSEHIATNSMSYSYMIGDYLQRFEITTGYTSSFANDDGIVRCDPDHIYYFKKFCDHINEGAILRPYRYYLGHNQTGACQLEYYSYEENTNHPKNDIFKLFYVFPYNLTHDMIRVYNETIDFRNWNYFTDGEFVDFVDCNRSNINFQMELMHKEPYWNTGLPHFGGQNESRVFTINYPILGKYDPTHNRTNILKNFQNNGKIEEKNKIEKISNFSTIYKSNETKKMNPKSNFLAKFKDSILSFKTKIMNKFLCIDEKNYSFARSIEEAKNKSIKKSTKEINEFNDTDDDSIIVTDVGSSFFTESLYVILKQKKNDKLSHYIITDYLYNVLIDNEMGAIYPKSFNYINQSIFPNISDINNSIWNSVENEIINVPIDVPLLVNVSTSTQYMLIKRIINARSRYSFYLIMLFEISPKITEIYSLVTNVFTVCLVFLSIVFLFMKFSMKYEDLKCIQKLKNKQKAMIGDNLKNPYMGNVTEAIEKLRTIQLMNSDDIHLNNSIDFVIKELTLNDENLFNIELDFNMSQFYPQFCSFCSYLIDNEHDLSILKNRYDEIKKIKEKEDLKSKKILNYYLRDANWSQKENKNDNKIYLDTKRNDDQLFFTWKNKMNLILYSNNDENILNTNPHKCLVLKFMKFILKRNLFLKEIYPDSLLSFILTFTKENIFSYHCKIKSFQLLKRLIKHNFKFWIKSKLDIFILFFASILRNSKIKKADDIVNLFNSFFHYKNDYFINLLKTLIDGTKPKFTMKIYGSLLNRTQSPDFSVPCNINDMILFMKAILSFIDFAPYLDDYSNNENCFDEINEMIFSKKEYENHKFVSYFHYEMSKNVVLPWLNLMNSISPDKNIKNTLINNINRWKDMIQVN